MPKQPPQQQTDASQLAKVEPSQHLDSAGQPLKVGDVVLVPAEIIAVYDSARCDLSLRMGNRQLTVSSSDVTKR